MDNSYFDFYTIDETYVKYIYDNYDKQIYYNENNKNYSDKPYIGIITEIGDFKYFILLTSAKPKHLSMKNNGTYHTLVYEVLTRKEINENKDIFKIVEQDSLDRSNDKVKKIYSLINYKKCVPVPDGCFTKIIINDHKN